MKNKSPAKSEIKYERDSIKKEIDLNKEKGLLCLLFEDKKGGINENIFFKEKEENNSFSLDKNKSFLDLNLTGKNLHEFLNDDLIEAIDNDLVEPKDIYDLSNDNSSNGYIEGSSEFTSKSNSPEFNIKYPKILKDINMNLNENSSEKNDSNKINYNYSVNKNITNNKIINLNTNNNDNNKENNQINEDEDRDIKNKNKINLIKNPNFTSKYIHGKINNNIEDIKLNKKKEYNFEDNNKKEGTNPSKNKFDEVEPIIMLSLVNREEKTKFPLEIRVGDWICLYCNNLNFSFRKKCNRCGLMKKSSTLLLKHKYFNNNFQNLKNYNEYDGYYMNYNTNINYDLNFDVNNYYDNNNNL